jgi:hypothetical protein
MEQSSWEANRRSASQVGSLLYLQDQATFPYPEQGKINFHPPIIFPWDPIMFSELSPPYCFPAKIQRAFRTLYMIP